MRAASILLVLTACGRVAFDPVGTLNSGDAGMDGPPCTFGAWGAPVNLTALNTGLNDWSPALSDDGLELIFESDRNANTELWHTVRASTSEPFSAPELLSNLNSPQLDTQPALTSDRLAIYFMSDRSGVARLYRADRPTPGGPFAMPVIVAELASIEIRGPSITSTNDELFYVDASQTAIARAIRPAQMWIVDRVLTELGTLDSVFPDVSRDGLTMYFEDYGLGAIVETTRPTVGAAFSTPAVVTALDANAAESDPDFGDRDRAIVFSSDRAGGSGSFDLWLATRSCD